MRTNGYTEVRPTLNGKVLEPRRFDRPGIETLRWDLPKRDYANAIVELTFQPASHFPPDPRILGAPVVSFGFVPPNYGHKTATP